MTIRPPSRPSAYRIRRRHVCRAMTLVELLIAIAICALIGAAAVAMLSATAYGTTSSRSMSAVLVKSHAVNARIAAAVRRSVEVVAAGDDYIILWLADDNEDEARQYGELQLVEYDTDDETLRSYSNAADATDFATASAFRTTAKASYTAEDWATGLTDISFTTDTAPPGTTIVNYRITVHDDLVDETSIGAATLRNKS